ncbi:MAG: orotate phosphoribosyltransferase [Candidatus Gracilibacteria bacterium]|nr:orotate phosphoribosyltransferase [Candidatus Gracilibacteria bacterium]
MLTPTKREFIAYCANNGVLQFNTETPFILKSGRKSPWFFNAGNLMQHGEGLARIARIYTDSLIANFSDSDGNIDADILYGPAYKGIPLAAVVAQEYYNRTGKSIGFSSHRKEIKDHGEGGNGFGMNVRGKSCILLDDVITAGTAFRKSVEDIEKDGGTVRGLVVLLDREEITGDASIPNPESERISAIMQAEKENNVTIVSSLSRTDVRSAIEENLVGDVSIGKAMDTYHETYGIYPFSK